MPSKSEKQKKLMRAAAHSEEFAKKVGIKQEIAKEFVDADKKKDMLKKPTTKRKKKLAIEYWSED